MLITVYRMVGVGCGLLCLAGIIVWALTPPSKSKRLILAAAVLAGFGCYFGFQRVTVLRDHEVAKLARKAYRQLPIARVWGDGSDIAYYTNAAKQGGRCNGTVKIRSHRPLRIVYTGYRPDCRQVLAEGG